MSDFKVETDIPAPPRAVSYPFKTMDVGESFVQPDPKIGVKIRGTIYQYGKRHGKKFTVKRLDDDEGYRIWRIA